MKDVKVNKSWRPHLSSPTKDSGTKSGSSLVGCAGISSHVRTHTISDTTFLSSCRAFKDIMLDIQDFIKERGGDPDKIRKSQELRHADVGLVDKVIELFEDHSTRPPFLESQFIVLRR